MLKVQDLIEAVQEEASREPMPVDVDVYAKADRSPLTPILLAGSLDARVAFFARDLGRDEVQYAEPLIGGAGQRVRRALYRAITGTEADKQDRRLPVVLDHVLLTNTVPYKPLGNKAFSNPVKARFRPYLEQMLVLCWSGDYIVTMGNEAFHWFAPYLNRRQLDTFWQCEDRYEREIRCTMTCTYDGSERHKVVTLAPLPHPSPLNRTYLARFPQMLENRLANCPLTR